MGAKQAKQITPEEMAEAVAKMHFGGEQIGYIRTFIAQAKVVRMYYVHSKSIMKKAAYFLAAGDEMLQCIIKRCSAEEIRAAAKITATAFRKWEEASGRRVYAQAPSINWPAVPTHKPGH